MRFKGSSEWSPIYMLIVMVIAAVLIVSLVKPMMRQSATVAGDTLTEAQAAAKSAIFFISLLR